MTDIRQIKQWLVIVVANACPVKLDFLFHQGFTALPGGERDSNDYDDYDDYDDYGYDAAFYSIDDHGYWWSASESYTGGAWIWYVFSGSSNIDRDNEGHACGFSVRCVRD